MMHKTKLCLALMKRSCIQKVYYSIRLSERPLNGIFFHPSIQFFMEKITHVDYEKIFRPRKMGNIPKRPIYRFLTDEELQAEKAKIETKAASLLQIPPIMDVVEDKTEILSNDHTLDGHDEHHSKIIFTDTSLDLNTYERSIVVREPNGVLRTANKFEKHRMTQIFFPVPGREMHTPKMFEPVYLENVLKRKDYEFLLDRACIQFEPTDEEFHRVLAVTYDRINQEMDFEAIDSTRHFGSLGFYLAVNKKINNMLLYFFQKERIMASYYLVKMYHIVNSSSVDISYKEPEKDHSVTLGNACKLVEAYISDSENKAQDLESDFNQLVEKLKNQQSSQSEVLKAHGL